MLGIRKSLQGLSSRRSRSPNGRTGVGGLEGDPDIGIEVATGQQKPPRVVVAAEEEEEEEEVEEVEVVVMGQ